MYISTNNLQHFPFNCHVSGTILGSGDTEVNKTEHPPFGGKYPPKVKLVPSTGWVEKGLPWKTQPLPGEEWLENLVQHPLKRLHVNKVHGTDHGKI